MEMKSDDKKMRRLIFRSIATSVVRIRRPGDVENAFKIMPKFLVENVIWQAEEDQKIRK